MSNTHKNGLNSRGNVMNMNMLLSFSFLNFILIFSGLAEGLQHCPVNLESLYFITYVCFMLKKTIKRMENTRRTI